MSSIVLSCARGTALPTSFLSASSQSSNAPFLVRLCRSMHMLRVQAFFFQKPQRISTKTEQSNALNGGPDFFQSRKEYFFANFYKGTQENSITSHCCHKCQSKYGKMKTNKMLCLQLHHLGASKALGRLIQLICQELKFSLGCTLICNPDITLQCQNLFQNQRF